MINKKAQEEIVGFVLVIVIVAVVFLIFLGFSVRTVPSITKDSTDVHQFLESSMEYTTDCVTSFYPDYRKLGEMFEECLSNRKCLDDRDSCSILNETLGEIIESGWQVGEDRPLKGYELLSFYRMNSESGEEEIIKLNSGNCTGQIRGASYLTPAFPGNIKTTLKICY
jgi:hypothetical protein|tara:strand:- start:675 stop:1178 length:504 start_codon:yes stop_codon:yes gene_type:complete